MEANSIIPRPVSEYDLRLLRIFKVVVECGGFSAAEPVLNITRSTISVHMSNLEARLKMRLAERGRGGFYLTDKGHKVYNALLILLRAIDDFAHEVASLDNPLEGELCLLCSDQVALTRQLKLPGIISALRESAPLLRPTVHSETIPNIEQALIEGKAHVGIMPDYRRIEGLVYQLAYREKFYLCIGAAHPLFSVADADISDAQIQQAPAIHPGVDVNVSGIAQFQHLNLSATAYQFDTRTPLVLSGCYMGFFPLSYIQGFLDRGEVRLLAPERRFYEVEHVVVTRQNAVNNAKIKHFFQAMQAVGLGLKV